MTADAWTRLRAMRADPPGLASSGARHDMFSAALQQFEELVVAATRIGPWSKPLPLYYALNQAGRAIAAAFSNEPWRVHGHGLRLDLQSAPSLLKCKVSPHGMGIYQRIAPLVGSEFITGEVELGELWSSLPDLVDLPLELEWPKALRVWPDPIGKPSGMEMLPWPWAEAAICAGSATSPEDVVELLANYPSAAGFELARAPGIPIMACQTPSGSGVLVRWASPEAHDFGHREKLLKVAPTYGEEQAQWLRPGLGEKRIVVSPLMTWWALVFGLSIVARYEPDRWASSLHVDLSPIAAALEAALVRATEVVPSLVLEALS